jgi:hypothetical protein
VGYRPNIDFSYYLESVGYPCGFVIDMRAFTGNVNRHFTRPRDGFVDMLQEPRLLKKWTAMISFECPPNSW